MWNIVREIKSTVDLFCAIHRAAKNDSLQVKKIRDIPIVNLGYWGATPEGCLFYQKKWSPVRDVFDSFDEETQHALTFAPKDGEWVERIRFWQKELRPVLDSKLYHEAMLKLIRWSIRCQKMRQEAVV
jgi:hypothetical protein